MESTLLSRSALTGSSSSVNTHHGARKKSSFMSFKDRTPASIDNYSSNATSPPSSPLSNTPRYFDKYPRRPSSSPVSRTRSNGRHTTSPSRDDVSYAESKASDKETGRQPKSSSGRSYLFPSYESDNASIEFPTGDQTPKPHSRNRTRSGPSSKGWKSPSRVPPLRFSGTSTVESPPRTPIESLYIRPSIERYPVVVGVEAMDAMVDGMNGLDNDTYFGGNSGESSRSKAYRSRFAKIPNHHPLYQPPLPKPPPGVILGGGKYRVEEASFTDSEDDEEDSPRHVAPVHYPHRRNGRPSSSPPTSKPSFTPPPASPRPPSDNSVRYSSFTSDIEEISTRRLSYSSFNSEENKRSLAPSISDIIRHHAPQSAQARGRQPPTRNLGFTSTHNRHATLREETESEPEPEPLTADEEAELITRSSIDSIANEVRQTMRNQRTTRLAADLPTLSRVSPIREFSTTSEIPTSPRSSARPVSSIYSASAPSINGPTSTLDSNSFIPSPVSPSQAIAQYLRSARLTTLLKLTRYPHATREQPLTVSLSDLGSPDGFPVVMFLGLGCVRHIMGLYDEMASILGLRLITIDRWGLGRTDTPRPKSARGIMEWASVVEEVLDMLNIEQCSVMAHSAGAPYALSFANRAPDRIRGDICLLAPWVGGSEGGGYKWLKYVPNSILKTAQAAEWKVQAWMIGKPPAVAYEGIGYNAVSPTSPKAGKKALKRKNTLPPNANSAGKVPAPCDGLPRPSVDSSNFSEYDDLRDFDGRFESRSTLGANPPSVYGRNGEPQRTPSKGFLRRLKSNGSRPISDPSSPTEPTVSPTTGSTRKLKALRSMGSLRGKTSSTQSTVGKKTEAVSPRLPKPLTLEVGLGFEDLDWTKAITPDQPSTPSASNSRPISSDTTSSTNTSDTFDWARAAIIANDIPSSPPPVTPRRFTSEMASVSDKSSAGYAPSSSRAEGRRSISFSAARSSPSTVPTSPVASTYTSPYTNSIANAAGGSYQAALGNALIAASHAESAKGTHTDFLQILNHDNRPWGFQYSSYPHKVKVWYGDKDEKIAENAVRWMERNMGEDRCQVKVVKGADHALMYKSAVVIEVLERIREQARTDSCKSWYTTYI